MDTICWDMFVETTVVRSHWYLQCIMTVLATKGHRRSIRFRLCASMSSLCFRRFLPRVRSEPRGTLGLLALHRWGRTLGLFVRLAWVAETD